MFHKSLAELYVSDSRYTATYDQALPAPGLAQHVRDATLANAARHGHGPRATTRSGGGAGYSRGRRGAKIISLILATTGRRSHWWALRTRALVQSLANTSSRWAATSSSKISALTS